MRTFRTHFCDIPLVLALGTATFVSCTSGGNSTPAPEPPKLVFTAPAPSDWHLVRDQASSNERLILMVWGPAGRLSRGYAMTYKVSVPSILSVYTAPPGFKPWSATDGLALYGTPNAITPLDRPIGTITVLLPANAVRGPVSVSADVSWVDEAGKITTSPVATGTVAIQ